MWLLASMQYARNGSFVDRVGIHRWVVARGITT
jgi:hypothetical protein